MNTVLRLAPALLAAVLSSAQPTSTPSNAISLAGSGYSVPSSALAVAPGQVIVLQVYGVTTAINSSVIRAELLAAFYPRGYTVSKAPSRPYEEGRVFSPFYTVVDSGFRFTILYSFWKPETAGFWAVLDYAAFGRQ